MELNHLKYFYIVAKEGSFTRAARTLRIQQPTISKMVRNLESQLQLVLVERHKKGVRLTKSGTEVLRACQEIFERVDEIRAFADRERAECYGPLAFGATDSVSSYLVPRILGSFQARHPKVRPSIFTGSSNLICDEILEGRIEFGIFFAVPDPKGFDIVELASVPFQIICASDRAHRFSRDARRDGVLPLIISREVDYEKGRPAPSLEMLRRNGIRFEAVVSSNTYDSQKRLVKEGLGAALIPGFMARNGIQNGTFSVLHPKRQFTYSLKLITRKGKILSKNASTFLDAFRQQAPALLEP